MFATRIKMFIIGLSILTVHLFITYFSKNNKSGKGETEENITQGSHYISLNSNIRSSLQETDDGQPHASKIILMTSMGRSGSTVAGDLLASKLNSIYFFEPFHKEKFTCTDNITCTTNAIKSILNCKISPLYENNFKTFFLEKINKKARECTRVYSNAYCYKQLNITEECLNSTNRIIKTIRTTVNSSKPFLSDKTNNLKFIHLARDPRGSIMSIEKYHWNFSTNFLCQRLLKDIKECRKLSLKYPFNIICIQYEHLSRNPIATMNILTQFLYGETEIAASTVNFIADELNKQYEGVGIEEMWRLQIKEKSLNNIENNKACKKVLNIMNYRLFRTKENARNLLKSLYKDNSYSKHL